MHRRLPCWSCGRPTPPTELVETHVRAGHTNRPGWWLSADRVIWLCPRWTRRHVTAATRPSVPPSGMPSGNSACAN
jgi:hypothetical protein